MSDSLEAMGSAIGVTARSAATDGYHKRMRSKGSGSTSVGAPPPQAYGRHAGPASNRSGAGCDPTVDRCMVVIVTNTLLPGGGYGARKAFKGSSTSD